jgi:hypothetical protein
MASYDPTSPLYGFKLWGFVHDELLMRGPASRAPEAADELARLMIKACDEVCPDYHIKTEPWVADVWSKFVKWPKGKDRDANGRLRVWRLNVAVREWRAELAAAQAEGNTKKALKLRKNLAAVGFAP